jgi:hypothetical protein
MYTSAKRVCSVLLVLTDFAIHKFVKYQYIMYKVLSEEAKSSV